MPIKKRLEFFLFIAGLVESNFLIMRLIAELLAQGRESFHSFRSGLHLGGPPPPRPCFKGY